MNKAREAFSLVEVVIIIGIMAIMTGIAALGLGFLTEAHSKDVAYKINSGLTELKSENTAKSEPTYMYVYLHDNEWYIDLSETKPSEYVADGKGKVFGDSEVSIKKDGTTLGDDEVMAFGMKKKDGSFSDAPDKIEVVANGMVDYTIQIVKNTGRHYIE